METKVDWQISLSNSVQRLTYMLEKKLRTDCKFLVGHDLHELVTIDAHKFVLAMASPVFETMFYGGMPEKDLIPVTDMEPQTFEALLQFIYTEKADIKSYVHACGLYYAAKKYMIPSINKHCMSYMTTNLNEDTACTAYEFAKVFDEEELLKDSFKKIIKKTRQVLKSESFQSSDLTTVELIFSQEWLNIDSELDLFNAAERYAQAHGVTVHCTHSASDEPPAKKRKLEDSQISRVKEENNNIDTKEIEEMTNSDAIDMRRVLRHIRFLTMSPEQFALGPGRSKLLPRHDVFLLFLNIAGVNAPLPEGYSHSTSRRNLMQSQEEEVERSEGLIELTVANFRTRKRFVESHPVTIGDLDFCLRITPTYLNHGTSDDNKFLRLHLRCSSKVANDLKWKIEALFCLIHKLDYDLSKKEKFTWIYSSGADGDAMGGVTMLPWPQLCDARNGFLRSNAVTVRVRVTVSPHA